jgi:two-component system sensor histidine kinase AlgZ
MRHQPRYRMNDSQILSTFQDLPPQPASGRGEHALVFDACHVGVILRAVLFVVAVVAVGAMFGTASLLDWLARTSIVTGGALPATLAWLIAGCSLKKPLARQRLGVQVAAGVGLGALAGLYGCGLLALAGFADPAPWLASASAGALLAGMLVAALVWRVKGRTPAATMARLTELQSRIRPHFLFNTLNTAIALVREEPERAESILEDLAELFRHALAEQGASATLDAGDRAGAALPADRAGALRRAPARAVAARRRGGQRHLAAAAAAAAGGKRRQARRGAQRHWRGDPHFDASAAARWR